MKIMEEVKNDTVWSGGVKLQSWSTCLDLLFLFSYVPSGASIISGLKDLFMHSAFCLHILPGTQLIYWLINADTWCIFKSFLCGVSFSSVASLCSRGVRRGENEHEPGTRRSQRWRSAERPQVSGYSSSSQLGKEENIHYIRCSEALRLLL